MAHFSVELWILLPGTVVVPCHEQLMPPTVVMTSMDESRTQIGA